jgi:hypothetical protein
LAKSTFEASGDVGSFANDTNSGFPFKKAQQDQGVNQNWVKGSKATFDDDQAENISLIIKGSNRTIHKDQGGNIALKRTPRGPGWFLCHD